MAIDYMADYYHIGDLRGSVPSFRPFQRRVLFLLEVWADPTHLWGGFWVYLFWTIGKCSLTVRKALFPYGLEFPFSRADGPRASLSLDRHSV